MTSPLLNTCFVLFVLKLTWWKIFQRWCFNVVYISYVSCPSNVCLTFIKKPKSSLFINELPGLFLTSFMSVTRYFTFCDDKSGDNPQEPGHITMRPYQQLLSHHKFCLLLYSHCSPVSAVQCLLSLLVTFVGNNSGSSLLSTWSQWSG